MKVEYVSEDGKKVVLSDGIIELTYTYSEKEGKMVLILKKAFTDVYKKELFPREKLAEGYAIVNAIHQEKVEKIAEKEKIEREQFKIEFR